MVASESLQLHSSIFNFFYTLFLNENERKPDWHVWGSKRSNDGGAGADPTQKECGEYHNVKGANNNDKAVRTVKGEGVKSKTGELAPTLFIFLFIHLFIFSEIKLYFLKNKNDEKNINLLITLIHNWW